MNTENFHHLFYSDNCLNLYCYIHIVSTNISFGLFQVFHVELGSIDDTLNRSLKSTGWIFLVLLTITEYKF